MDLFLGIDLGTSYFKAGLFDKNGKLKGLGRQLVRKNTNGGKICELPVDIFWDTLQKSIRQAMKQAQAEPHEIKTVSYSSQANSFILLDKNHTPLTPLILWPDKRAEGVELPFSNIEINESLKDSGLGALPNEEFAIAKIEWFRKKEPELWSQVKSILSISGYLTFVLTGEKVSDLSTASLTGLVDVKNNTWHEEVFQILNLDIGLFPGLKRISTSIGKVTKEGAKLSGLAPGTSYYLGGLDHHIAALGAGVYNEGVASESTGTVLAFVKYGNSFQPRDEVYIAHGLDKGHYFELAFTPNGAAALEWYREHYARSYSFYELLELASDVPPGCGGLVAQPCVNSYHELSGFNTSNAESSLSHGHYVRAILESTAGSLAGLISLLGSNIPDKIVATGGGAKSKLWLQVKANKLNIDFYLPECTEAACLGAAMIGAKGYLKVSSWDEMVGSWVKYKEAIKPNNRNN